MDELKETREERWQRGDCVSWLYTGRYAAPSDLLKR